VPDAVRLHACHADWLPPGGCPSPTQPAEPQTERGLTTNPLLFCRRKFCLAVRTARACLLFDCCEDAQRALLHAPHVRPSRITRIFISCLDGDQVYGLPGDQLQH